MRNKTAYGKYFYDKLNHVSATEYSSAGFYPKSSMNFFCFYL